MTVGELIRYLKDFPKDMPVLVDGYEEGFDEPVPPQIMKVYDRQGPETEQWYFGRYDIQPGRDDAFEAVIIRRPEDGAPEA